MIDQINYLQENQQVFLDESTNKECIVTIKAILQDRMVEVYNCLDSEDSSFIVKRNRLTPLPVMSTSTFNYMQSMDEFKNRDGILYR